MVSMTPTSPYVTSASCYQNRSLMAIRGLIPRNSSELAKAVLIVKDSFKKKKNMSAGTSPEVMKRSFMLNSTEQDQRKVLLASSYQSSHISKLLLSCRVFR